MERIFRLISCVCKNFTAEESDFLFPGFSNPVEPLTTIIKLLKLTQDKLEERNEELVVNLMSPVE